MFVKYNKDSQRVPIKAWLDESGVEEGCMAQALNLARLPFAFKHVALMPDAHMGYGMPIGGVLATENVIIPNAVGVDIGCGVNFIETDIPVAVLDGCDTPGGPLKNYITGQIMRATPTGFAHHDKPQASTALDGFYPSYPVDDLMSEGQAAYCQIGTLGGGNHFLEIQAAPGGRLCIMLHSGSRNLGYKIAGYFDKEAARLNVLWHSAVPAEWQLAFLPVDSEEGQAYIEWMNLALLFAKENRAVMMRRAADIVFAAVARYAGFEGKIVANVDVHHNYAAIENHFGRNVWVHRKGAIRARKGEFGIVPGAMGAASYIVEGLGNPESFCSCSHGAGRRMGRKEAMRQFAAQDVVEDLAAKGIVLGKTKRDDVAEECLWAYKDIEEVIQNELDLASPITRLVNVGIVVKG